MTNLCKALRAARARRAAYADLIRLDERSLEDIGFNRADVDIRWG